MLSDRGPCDELNTRPEESCRLWCVVACDLEKKKPLVNEDEGQDPLGGLSRQEVCVVEFHVRALKKKAHL